MFHMFQEYPCIDDYGEINWRYQRKDVLEALKQRGLAVYDWYAGAYITWPTTLDRIRAAVEVAQQHNLTIYPHEEPDLSVERLEELMVYFSLKRLAMSQADFYKSRLAKPLKRQLSPFIKAGVLYAVHTHRCFIADPEPGDRRLISLAAVHQVQGYPCVLVCRQQERQAWIELIKQYLPDTLLVLDANASAFPAEKDAIWLLDYNDLQHNANVSFRGALPRAIIVDHAHYIKNRDANRTQAVATIAEKLNYRFLLTDFPLNLSPSDLKDPLEILGRQAEFGELKGFLENISTNPLDNRCIGSPNERYQGQLGTLYRKLRATCLVRRADDPGLRAQQHLQLIGLTNIPERIDPNTVHSPTRWLGLSKVAQAIAWLCQFLSDAPGKVLIFAHHNDVVEEIAAELNLLAIYGKVADESQRDEWVSLLTQTDEVQALVMASDVELGWDMQAVSAIVFAELLITPRQLHGIVDHILGKDTDRSLPVYLLYADHSLDWDALGRLDLRLEDYDWVMDGLIPE